MLKLTPSDDGSRYYISTHNASPRLDADAITLVTEDLVLSHIPLSKFAPIYGIDFKNGGINPIKDASSHTRPELFARAQGKPPMFAKLISLI
jgi:hypothetical protein